MFQIFCQLLCMLVLPCTRFSIGSVLSFIVIKFCKSVRHAHWEGLVSSSLLHYLLTQFHVHWYVIFFLLLLSEEGMTFMYINFHDQCSLTLSASHFCLQITVTITTTTIYYTTTTTTTTTTATTTVVVVVVVVVVVFLLAEVNYLGFSMKRSSFHANIRLFPLL